jgi:hypothetical protein
MPKVIIKIEVKKQLLLLSKLQHNGEVVLCNNISLLLLLNGNFSNKMRRTQWFNKITQLLQQFSLRCPLQSLQSSTWKHIVNWLHYICLLATQGSYQLNRNPILVRLFLDLL